VPIQNPYSRFFLFFAFGFVLLFLAFSSAVYIPYTNHDSIRYFHKFYNHQSDGLIYPQYNYEYNLGRPLAAELDEFLYRHIQHLSDMSTLRFLVITSFALSVALLATVAVAQGISWLQAFGLSVAIFTLPGIEDFIFVPYIANALAILVALLGNLLLLKSLKYHVHWLLAVICLLISFCLYPPSTLFFLVPSAMGCLLASHENKIPKIALRDFMLWVLVAGSYYLILRGLFYAQIKSSGHEISFSFKQLVGFALAFIPQATPQIFNFWNVYWSAILGASILLFISVFILFDCWVAKNTGIKRWGIFIVLFLATNLTWFLFDGYDPREYIASQGLGLICLYWAGLQVLNLLKLAKEWMPSAWLVLLLVVGLFMSNQLITLNVLNNYSELMFVRSRIAQYVNTSTSEIHIIWLKSRNRGYNGLPTIYDNINSTVRDYEIPDLIRVALKDMGQPFELHCIITYSNLGETYSVHPDAVIINMNDLDYISSPQRI